MTDFSRFGYPSTEWEDHVEKYGPPPETPIGKMSAVAIQRSTNAGREEASAQQMMAEGENCTFTLLSPSFRTEIAFRSLI